VVREHKATIGNGRDLTLRLLSELDATTSRVGELEDMIVANVDDAKKRTAMMRAVSLPGRAGVMRDLAQAARTWVSLERQAFGIVEDKVGEKAVSTEGVRASDLWAELVQEAIELGLPLPVAPDDDASPIEGGRVSAPRHAFGLAEMTTRHGRREYAPDGKRVSVVNLRQRDILK
jgi:hypothetical protein